MVFYGYVLKMQRTPSSEKVTIAFDADLAAQLHEYQRALGLENLPETVRVMLRQQIAAVPWMIRGFSLRERG